MSRAHSASTIAVKSTEHPAKYMFECLPFLRERTWWQPSSSMNLLINFQVEQEKTTPQVAEAFLPREVDNSDGSL